MESPGAQDNAGLDREIERRRRAVLGLRRVLYAEPDPTADAALVDRLAAEESALAELEKQRAAAAPARPAEERAESPPRGRFLGPKTSGLKVEPVLQMQPIPTGVYHLLDPKTDPLLTVTVGNLSRDPRRVCIKAFLEGLSAQAVRTVEIDPRQEVELKLLPTLLPERAASITEVQRATLHVIAEDLEGKPESHDTFPVVCLARTSSFNAVRRPQTGETVDLSHYYGAWVTPHDEEVQKLIREAAELLPDRRILGYLGDEEEVTRQVGALFQVLKDVKIKYVNSVIDFGAPPGQATQRTRLPRQSLDHRAANCIDGTVLFASLLEGASLSPGLVIVPGHALVAWETSDGSDEWRYLETTLVGGDSDFAAACQSGQRKYDLACKVSPDRVVMHRVSDLRARGIWPMA
jgi:hypothetical protein